MTDEKCSPTTRHTGLFHPPEFLDWLDDQEGPVSVGTLNDEWPSFPIERLQLPRGPVTDENYAYRQADLRRVAERYPVVQ